MADEKTKIGPTHIHGVGSTTQIDTAGEIVDLAGLDCSSLIGGALNWEHLAAIPAQLVGKVLDYKKIFSEKDCENEHHKYFWDKCKSPYLYVMGRLFDDKKESSKECAALFIDDAEHPDEKPIVGFSIEGSKIDKQGMVVTKSIGRKLTITHAPANKQCVAELIPAEPQKMDEDSIFKSETSITIELFEKAESLVKTEPLSKARVDEGKSPSEKAKARGERQTERTKIMDQQIGHKEEGQKGINRTSSPALGWSEAGSAARMSAKMPASKIFKDTAHNRAKKVLAEMKSMPKPKLDKAESSPSKPIPGAKGWSGASKQGKHGTEIHISHPEHSPIMVHKNPQSGNFEVKQAGALANFGGKKGIHSNAKDAIAHAHGYVKAISAKTTMPKQMADPGKLGKAMTAGSTLGAPQTLTGGAALQSEHLDKKMKKVSKAETGHEKGVHTAVYGSTQGKDFSNGSGEKQLAGQSVSSAFKNTPRTGFNANKPSQKEHHKQVLGELKSMPKPKLGKSENLKRAEQEYQAWGKREEFEKFMKDKLPHLSKGEIIALGQVLALNKSLKREKNLSKMIAGSELHSWVQKKESKE